MKLITPQTYIICVFIVLFSFIICLIDKLWENSKLNIVLLIILLFFPIKKIIAKKSQGKPENYFNTLPIKTFVKVSFWLYDINEKFELLKVEAKKPSTWQITENILPKTEIVVLIVGESLRKDFLHSYGFPINNTPFIDSSPHIKFNNYISVASTTSNSLSKTLALSRNLVNYEPYNNIVTLAKKIGYKSYWISSQEPISGHGSPIAQIALNTDEYFFMNNETTRKNDKDLFKNYLAISNNKSSPKFIVLHMIGSHPAIGDRVEYQYDEYLVSKEISYYNKSVKNTDAFLGQIYQNLKSTKKSFKMIYISDHGLGINSSLQISHDDNVQESYNVPLILWGDDITKSTTINSSRSAKDFLHLFSEFLNVKTKNIDLNYKFISEDKSSDDEILIIDSNNKIKKFNDLKSNSIMNYLKN